jgi:plastocyanin
VVLTRRLLAVAAGALALMPGAYRAQEGVTLQGRVAVALPPLPAVRPDIRDLGTTRHAGPDRRRSVVYLDTAPRAAFEEPRERRARLDQRNETFVPHVLAVSAGTAVDFPNNDPVYHNVFSLSETKSFDLGRYAAGRSKAVVFDRPGIVRVFCDIHSHMNAWILVFGHRYFAVAAEDGSYRIDGIPPGTYRVRVWNEALSPLSRQVTLPPGGGPVTLDFTLADQEQAR